MSILDINSHDVKGDEEEDTKLYNSTRIQGRTLFWGDGKGKFFKNNMKTILPQWHLSVEISLEDLYFDFC